MVLDQRFRLTSEPGGFGLSCSPEGLSLAGVPLLQKMSSGFEPRPAKEVGQLLKRAYGIDMDPTSFLGGLQLVAKALNQNDVGRAMIGALQLQLPELNWDGAARIAQAQSILMKYNPNYEEERRDRLGQWTDGSGGDTNEEVTPDTITPAAYNGFYHDRVVSDYAKLLRSKGETVLTEVNLIMADGSASARIDILAFDPTTGIVYGVEVKTGDNPGFTPGQLTVYPHLMWGESVLSTTPRVAALGLLPNIPLPPVPIYLMLKKNENSHNIINELDPDKMKRYYRGKVKKSLFRHD